MRYEHTANTSGNVGLAQGWTDPTELFILYGTVVWSGVERLLLSEHAFVPATGNCHLPTTIIQRLSHTHSLCASLVLRLTDTETCTSLTKHQRPTEYRK